MTSEAAWTIWAIVAVVWLCLFAGMLNALTSDRLFNPADKRAAWMLTAFGAVWVLPVAIRVWLMVMAA